MANDKTKPTEEDIAPKHAKAPSADASDTGDGSHKKRPKIAALVVLLVVLGVTSFAFVKRQMSTASWKKVQKLAYPFFGLVYVHPLLMLLPSALHGGLAAQGDDGAL